MADLGIRVIRIYTLHSPAFYDELATWNEAHPDAPLYLVQGVYLPDETYTEVGRTLYTPAVDDAFAAELRDVSAAVHGDLTRPPRAGRASGRWHTDVSPWLVSWVVGVEWEPLATARTDALAPGSAPYEPGRFFRATDDATNTERWLARHLDALAAAEHERGVSVPIAFVNWPTTDPLEHPEEPLPEEDLVGVDAEHVLPTEAWPGGTFASFHAYPYYPDFQRHEPGLQVETGGRVDPYAAYLRALQEHFVSMPLLVTEFGVPSSLGSAHLGPLGRDQGDAHRAGGDADRRRADAADPRPGAQRGVRVLLGRRVVQADLEHRGDPGRRAPAALARPADQRAVVRGARHRRRRGAGRLPRAGAGRRPARVRAASARTRRTSTSTSPGGTPRRPTSPSSSTRCRVAAAAGRTRGPTTRWSSTGRRSRASPATDSPPHVPPRRAGRPTRVGVGASPVMVGG